jgi:hypothetical protein
MRALQSPLEPAGARTPADYFARRVNSFTGLQRAS